MLITRQSPCRRSKAPPMPTRFDQNTPACGAVFGAALFFRNDRHPVPAAPHVRFFIPPVARHAAQAEFAPRRNGIVPEMTRPHKRSPALPNQPKRSQRSSRPFKDVNACFVLLRPHMRRRLSDTLCLWGRCKIRRCRTENRCTHQAACCLDQDRAVAWDRLEAIIGGRRGSAP